MLLVRLLMWRGGDSAVDFMDIKRYFLFLAFPHPAP